MKKRFFLFVVVSACAMMLYAQSNVSKPMDFHIVKGSIPPVLEFVEGSLQFVDANNNNVIDANENCKIRFQITNVGRGDGYGCEAKVKAVGTTAGVKYYNLKLPTIPHGSSMWLEVPIEADENTETGEITFSINVIEPQGYGVPQTITTKIGTHKLKIPNVQMVSYKIGNDMNATLQRRMPFVVQLAVQNIDQGKAENVRVHLTLPANVNWMGGENMAITIPELNAGETKYIEYELMANQDAAEQIDLILSLSESKGKYANGRTIPLTFGQHIGGTVSLNVERKDQEVKIRRASLVSDVDEDIPETGKINNNTFAVIIANEQYKEVANVPFAQNDGSVFREYCMKVLGVPANHIKYQLNATGNEIKQLVNWLENISSAFTDSKIIFYYAGHGIPNYQDGTAYLLPTDGSASDFTTCYKLADLYDELADMPAENIIVLLDACFSGYKRDGETFGAALGSRSVAIKVKHGQPRGNTIVLSAAQGDQTAQPYNEQQHGMFTYFLLKKLKDTEGNVDLKTLSDYIQTNVKQQSILKNNKSQIPGVIPSAAIGAEWQTWKLQ